MNVNKTKELNIFISYGHVNNGTNRPVPPVIDIIKDRLTSRKHHIFLDVEQLPKPAITNWPDSDWRSAIYNEINKSDDVVGFLSEKALRQGGVCLDELSIAVAKPGRRVVTVLLESQKTMKIPPTISRIQWVDMSDWESHFDKETKTFIEDGYFDEKFEEIVNRIESEENFIYQYDINFLHKTLNPSNTVNTDLIRLLQDESDSNGNFIYENRSWLEEHIKDFIAGKKHYLLLTGGPGYGKSQFVAHCIHNIEDVYAYYFIRYNRNEEKSNCNLFLRTLAFELAAKMPDYRSSLIDSIKMYPVFNETRLTDVLSYFLKMSDRNLFNNLFHCDTIHFIDGDPGKIVIVIDALDEAEQAGTNPIVDLMLETKKEWPPFFKFILTSRETGNISQRFNYLAEDLKHIRLEADESEEDISNYLRKRLRYEDIDDEEFKVLIQKCEKTFIYAQLLIRSIEEGFTKLTTIEDINALPKDYPGQLLYYFERAFPVEQYEKVKIPLGIMIANGGSIEKTVLEQIMRKTQPQWAARSFVLQMKSFVVAQGESIVFYHKAINDWLQCEDASAYYLDPTIYKRIIVDFCRGYIESFNEIAWTDYSDSIGLDLFEDAEENGFDYSIVKFVYQSCFRFMLKVELNRLKKTQLAFLVLVLWEMYRHSELLLVDDVFKVIGQAAKQLSIYEKRDRFYIAAAYNVIGEAELQRGNRIPQDNTVNEQTVTADTCYSAIEYFWFIRKSVEELPEYGKLYASIVDNIAFCTRLMDNKSHEKLALALSILEELKQYEEEKRYDGVEISLAHLYYHEGIIYYDIKDYLKALDCLQESERYINQYEEEDFSLGEGLLALVLNQRAGCYNKMAIDAKITEHEEAEEYYAKSIVIVKESLKLKTRIYGMNSSYVATAYHNLARYQKDYEVSQSDFEKLSDDVYDYINEAIRIKKLLFSENGKDTAYSYMQKAWCMDADCRYDQQMIELIQKAVSVDPKYIADAKKLFGNAVAYHMNSSNNSMVNIFELELRKLN